MRATISFRCILARQGDIKNERHRAKTERTKGT